MYLASRPRILPICWFIILTCNGHIRMVGKNISLPICAELTETGYLPPMVSVDPKLKVPLDPCSIARCTLLVSHHRHVC